MAYKFFTPPPVATVKYNGIFDYDRLVDFVFGWFTKRGYDFTESVYKHKEASPGFFEDDRKWDGEKKVTETIKYKITIEARLWEYETVEVVKDGKKKKMAKARLRIQFKPSIEVDYEGRWEKSAFHAKLRHFMYNYVLKKEIIIKHVDKLYYITLGLQTKIKDLLEMGAPTSAY